jgi:hypothetical protein
LGEEDTKRHVVFDEDSEEEEKAPISLSEDTTTIDIETLEEEDPLKEIESKIESELVLNL